MIHSAIDLLVIFVLAAFVGFEVISKVPSILHTPLMSGSNAIHGIILVGAMVIASEAQGALQTFLALLAVILATLNIVGGVAVTDRMLEMFKGRNSPRPAASGPAVTSTASPTATATPTAPMAKPGSPAASPSRDTASQ